jgi:hypothetical protein
MPMSSACGTDLSFHLTNLLAGQRQEEPCVHAWRSNVMGLIVQTCGDNTARLATTHQAGRWFRSTTKDDRERRCTGRIQREKSFWRARKI